MRVHAGGRLHLGFLDPGASLGRRYGSVGLVIDGFETVVEMQPAGSDLFEALVPGSEAELARVRTHVESLRRHSGRREALHVQLLATLEPHCGFGSGTQLALATGRAFAALFGLPWSTLQIAQLLGRGARSGVGIGGFDSGGFIVDGGPGGTQGIAPVLARLPFPQAWRVIVVEDPQLRGLHGRAEAEALARLPPFPREHAAQVCHRVLMQLLPALAEADFMPFAEGLTAIQARIGAHFAPVQAGSAYTSPAVGRFMDWVARSGMPAGLGQSSWGPAAFAFVASQADALQLMERAHAAGVGAAPLRLRAVQGRNTGARIVTA